MYNTKEAEDKWNIAFFHLLDAYRPPQWVGAGRRSWSQDAALLPFWEQCYISEQVWIMQPTEEDQCQPHNPQVRIDCNNIQVTPH